MNQELHVTDDLSAYLANELDQNERSSVELHLRDCESCRKELEKHKRLNEVLGGSQPISPGPEIIRGVMQQVQHEQKTIAFKRLLPWLAVAAVLVAVLFLLRIQKETPVPGEVVKKTPPVIKPINPRPFPKESPQTQIENPPVVKNTPPKEPIVKPVPQTIPEETPQIAEQVNPQTSISPEDEEMIAKIDELENMDVISNYENLENLEVAIIDEGGGSQR
ncbi:zf-HC2 domain-containing protein [bacterium]|nr:zf-HC2 domain-containing protein [bacterium]